MRLGTCFGVTVKLNPYFLVLMVVLAALGRLPESLLVFGVVLFHELGHVVVARRQGVRVDEIELLPFGGVARMEAAVDLSPAVEQRIAVAGPLSNLLLICGGLALRHAGWLPTDGVHRFIEINAAIGLFNLLPAFPLDGGRIYRARLVQRVGFRHAMRRVVAVSRGVALALAFAGGAGLALGAPTHSLILVAGFIYVAAAQERSMAPYVLMGYLTRKRRELDRLGCMGAEPLVARADASVGEVSGRFVPQRYHLILVLDEAGELVGITSEREVIDGMLSTGTDTPLAEILRR